MINLKGNMGVAGDNSNKSVSDVCEECGRNCDLFQFATRNLPVMSADRKQLVKGAIVVLASIPAPTLDMAVEEFVNEYLFDVLDAGVKVEDIIIGAVRPKDQVSQ